MNGKASYISLILGLIVSLAAFPGTASQGQEVVIDLSIDQTRVIPSLPEGVHPDDCCLEYRVQVYADGTITYVGKRNVRIVGVRSARIDPQIVEKVFAISKRIRFFELPDVGPFLRIPDEMQDAENAKVQWSVNTTDLRSGKKVVLALKLGERSKMITYAQDFIVEFEKKNGKWESKFDFGPREIEEMILGQAKIKQWVCPPPGGALCPLDKKSKGDKR